MLQYILECIAFQLVFLIIYDLFLKRETFFQWNRAYLICTYIISMVLPWIKIEALKTEAPEVFQGYSEFLWNTDDAAVIVSNIEETSFSMPWEYLVLFSGMFLASIFLVYKLYQIYSLKQKGEIQYFKDFTRIVIANSSLAFSFFKSIFLGDKVLEKEHQNILEHELVHIREKHSYDLMFFELMRIVGWFNPLVYVYQNRVSELHEYIADAKVAKTYKKEQYQFLLSQVFQTQNISFINQFFKSSLIKKRIVMLQKTQSKKLWKLKYVMLIPLVFGMLAYTSTDIQNLSDTSKRLNSDDSVLIAEIEEEIEKETIEKGSMKVVLYEFYSATHVDGEMTILSKRDYFKQELLFGKLTSSFKVEFGDDVKPRKVEPKRPLPSTMSYEAYVHRETTFQVLDKNLKISINQKELDIRVVVKEDKNLGPGEYITVGDVKDLTGDEIRNMNRIIDQLDFTNKILFFSDDTYAFVISKLSSESLQFDEVINKENKNNQKLFFSSTKTIEVKDIENVTNEEEKKIFKVLAILSKSDMDWRLIVKDENSKLIFVKSEDGSSISAPNGEKIFAKMTIDSKLSSEDQEFIGKFVEKQAADKSNVKNSIYKVTEPVPFAKVDEVPVFPGCEDDSNTRACFQQKMQRHISKNFNYPLEAQEKGIQGRVSIIFTIDTEGNIANVRMRGPDKLLEAEAARIIDKLPRMSPGKHKGKIVEVSYSIPITFRLQNQSDKFQFINADGVIFNEKQKAAAKQYNQLLKERGRLLKSSNEKNPVIVDLDEQLKDLRITIYQSDNEVPFGIIDQVPVFPGCDENDNKRACFNKMMQKHIGDNFQYPKEAQEKGIQGRVNIMFTIGKDGVIKNLRMRGPDKLLEGEAKRIIMRLPDMKPGVHKGKKVDVPFSMPISFKLGEEKDTVKKMFLPFNDVDPLIFIDGKESTKSELENLNQDDIATINVSKDGSAIQVYGEKGKNGVVVVITKKRVKEETIKEMNFSLKNSNPIFIIDGKESTKAEMEKINKHNIATINILKDESAIKEYGEKGENGVVVIVTKKEK